MVWVLFKIRVIVWLRFRERVLCSNRIRVIFSVINWFMISVRFSFII